MPDVARGRRAVASLNRVSLERRRAFRVLLLPAGTTRQVTYDGKRVAISF
jgi:hypothetical protein